MSAFYKTFLLEDPRRLAPETERNVFLAAFGKHPGWDDHIEDLGLETESLIFAKKLLYVEGIGGQIDAGAWEKLEAAQQIPEFRHVFLWLRGSQYLLGRMWSSSDGKGRTRYPMIVCAHCVGLPLERGVSLVLPRLAQVEEACLLTRSADEVKHVLATARGELRSAAQRPGDRSAPLLSGESLAQLLQHPALGPAQEGWFRILYQMQSQVAPYAPGRFSLKGDFSTLRPQQIRVPPCGGSPPQTILLWTRFLQAQIDPAVPLLLTLPLEEAWLDLTIGEPASHEFFSLRASPKSMPPANEVPYTLDDTFRQTARALLDSFQRGEAAGVASSEAAAAAGNTASRPKWLRWLGGGGARAI